CDRERERERERDTALPMQFWLRSKVLQLPLLAWLRSGLDVSTVSVPEPYSTNMNWVRVPETEEPERTPSEHIYTEHHIREHTHTHTNKHTHIQRKQPHTTP